MKAKYWHEPEDEDDEFSAPTHWMPLPSAPTAAKVSA